MHVQARVFALLWLAHVCTKAENTTRSCMFLYEKGVEAYLDNSFDKCVLYFENALQEYRDYSEKLKRCRLTCRQEAEAADPLFPVNVEDLLFYEKAVRNTLCIVKCKKKGKILMDKFNVNKETERLFEERRPYEYLHICYFQNKEYQKAASASFTYLVSHLDDKMMLANLKHYSSLEGVDITDVVNYEAEEFVYLYIHGADSYEKKDWDAVIQYMEESLDMYLQAEEECRALCEGPFDQGWHPDFVPSIANHFTFCLKCKQNCTSRLSSLNGEIHEDLLPSHYHYLQYAYFKKGNLKEACAAVASYLLFYPDDETMLENKEYYGKLPKGSADLFVARPEAKRYVQRLIYETRILKFIAHQFKFDHSVKITPQAHYRVVLTEKYLQGPSRFVAEGLATNRECQMLVDVAQIFGLLGDGYEGQRSPHTIMEDFSGVTLKRASLLVYFGLLDVRYLRLLLELTDRAKRKVQEYFNLKRKLYFSYTHLVSRSPVTRRVNRTDFSHPIHADNCIFVSNTTCVKKAPAFSWRDYSAVIFLNSNFEGGEFIFSEGLEAEHVQSVVMPSCGKMVAFSSGVENLHGVRAVRKGSRFALAMWFTYDKNHVEVERDVALQALNLRK